MFLPPSSEKRRSGKTNRLSKPTMMATANAINNKI